MDKAPYPDSFQVLPQLEAIQKASKDLQSYPVFVTNIPVNFIKALLELANEADNILSTDIHLFKLSQSLGNLKALLEKLEKSQSYGLKSILSRQVTNYKISQLAHAIEAEIRAYIDRKSIRNLVMKLEESENEDEKVKFLIEFEKRVLQGFDRDFQDLVLKAKVFSILENILSDSTCSKRVRDQAALVIVSLVEFNRDVFVGLVLMGPTIQALISMASCCSIQVLKSLIKLIKSHLIDELLSIKEIPRIVSLLSTEDLEIKVAAIDCICEIAYFGRREVIEAMFNEGLIKKLVEFQRSKDGDNLTDLNQNMEDHNGTTNTEEGANMDTKMEDKDERIVGICPFASCVARFAVQIEVGEGMSQKEKKEIKLEILEKVREASVSEAEAATIVAEVLWGSSP
ncbi:hypothetical protein CFOL_v3_04067 [Cephalotus follicularis]|uniref:Uncharacterized protein n=1 Tax=Cephalotus follicularis TaxID=3775 RepID=A0A1Q3AXT6_CEPFO|nr:hypothetical protein CFOL_v3_04067 [Cephalotus follicularis]